MKYPDRIIVTVIGIALILLPNKFVFAQAPDTLWTKIYDRDWDDRAYSIRQTSDSGYIIAATTSPSGATYDAWLLKTDANGDTLWTKTYGGIHDDRGLELQLTTDGGFIIAGATASFGAGDYDVWLLKTDSLGDTLWTKTYGSTESDKGASVQQTLDGGYIITGGTFSFGAGEQDVYLIKTDSLGDTLWTRTYGGAKREAALSVQQTSDKGYILAGATKSFVASDAYDAYLIKTDSLGNLLWTKTYGDSWNNDLIESVKQTFDNGYIMTGFTASYGNAGELYLIKTDENGDTLWTRYWGNTHNMDYGYSVIQIPDSNYIVAGYYCKSKPEDHYPDVWLLKVDKTGDTLWTVKYTRFPADSILDDWVHCVERTFDGGYILAGKAGGWMSGDIYLIKTAPDTLGIKENRITNLSMLNLEVYPNPFRENMNIRYQIPDNNDVNVVIYDVSGRLVKTLPCPTPHALRPTLITWDGSNDAGDKLSSGIYFLRFYVDKYVETVKLLLVR